MTTTEMLEQADRELFWRGNLDGKFADMWADEVLDIVEHDEFVTHVMSSRTGVRADRIA